jgi:chemotaxis methyl-accepting protein methylase/signal transduction histidine kinase
LVQDPNSADFPDRLKALIDTGLASTSSAPEAMPTLIGRFVDTGKIETVDHQAEAAEQMALSKIFRHLAERFHLDLAAYRRSMVARRIHRRAALSHADDLMGYAAYLETDDQETEQLYDDLLIGVTAFFRDPEAFSTLASKVLPALMEQSPYDQPRPGKTIPDKAIPEKTIRVWVPACATGEEAYSLAMLIMDHLGEAGLESHVEIKATDRHLPSLEKARLGSYAPEQLLSLPSNLIERYMEPVGERLRVRDSVRNLVTFVEHDLIHDQPLSGMDLVSCRNLLIHLAPTARDQALATCCQALTPNGFLFLGPSELPGSSTDGLSVIDRRWRIYQRTMTRPADPALKCLPDIYRERPAETIQPPTTSRPAPFYPPMQVDDGRDESGMLDGMMEQNQQMLESTIDTLLASNDALRRRNRDLRTENQRLSAANTALEDIATLVAHDLKAPLRAVDHLAKRLEARLAAAPDQSSGGDDLQHMQLRLVGLHRLIDDLLTYARQDARHDPGIEQLELGDLIREVLVVIGLPPGFRLEVRPPSLTVRTRRIPLECVLRNLLGNAIAHHGGETGNIQIAMIKHDNALEIQITDDGSGMEGRCEGLGLAIVRQLLAAVGAHLQIAPRNPESGTEARFTWPIEQTQ